MTKAIAQTWRDQTRLSSLFQETSFNRKHLNRYFHPKQAFRFLTVSHFTFMIFHWIIWWRKCQHGQIWEISREMYPIKGVPMRLPDLPGLIIWRSWALRFYGVAGNGSSRRTCDWLKKYKRMHSDIESTAIPDNRNPMCDNEPLVSALVILHKLQVLLYSPLDSDNIQSKSKPATPYK